MTTRPILAVDSWTDTRDTLHRWLQIVGKIRMVSTPHVNHWWNVTLHVTPRGLATGTQSHGDAIFDIEFDFVEHRLVIRHSDARERVLHLEPMSVADFSSRLFALLSELNLHPRIHGAPNEVELAIPFAEDTRHASYDRDAAHAFWRQLVDADRALARFRVAFTGKVSPVHFFWGAMDLAVTRFSGREAPRHPGGAPNCPNEVMIEGYSHEISSAGFWPGGGREGAYYSYAYPAPVGFADARVPEGAYWDEALGEYLLPYEVVREAADPDGLVQDFLTATYRAEADLADWASVTTSA
ncbi:DUF5996 family protein [Pseudoclavibacter sp. RFBA6]|uniref:DUF5996 family protein n=1 Tax=Pseudoclavibacter sp. RFBA6 TaxID=2080573 RepID=UPI000CE8460E|nr:DUF5996 family protein [Pseudoclavibacter sp. RFBA6]PPG39208.1 hypothetical protein C5C17_10355 [Pseudoclavibacter sp. RFBA6]